MLTMKCPSCEKYIKSVLLAEISSIVCEHCGSEVPVKNILVSSNGFTFDRNDLLKRFFRYRKLLDEVIDEQSQLKENPAVRAESKRSISQFLGILQGMMAGARDHFRCEFKLPVNVRILYGDKELEGTFYNLSMDGACVMLRSAPVMPKIRDSLRIRFFLPDCIREFVLSGEICWAEKAKENRGPLIGLRFDTIDKQVQEELWNYICKAAREVPI